MTSYSAKPSAIFSQAFELIMAEGDFVIVHGRYSKTGFPVNWVVADIV